MQIKEQIGVGKSGLEKAREVADCGAMTLLENCRQAYLDAQDGVRRNWNRAIFKAIYVGDGLVKAFDYREPFAALLVTQDKRF
jgi:hypothetical protein